jgi:hypothetical protein
MAPPTRHYLAIHRPPWNHRKHVFASTHICVSLLDDYCWVGFVERGNDLQRKGCWQRHFTHKQRRCARLLRERQRLAENAGWRSLLKADRRPGYCNAKERFFG